MLGEAPPAVHLAAVLACFVDGALGAQHGFALVALVRPIMHPAALLALYPIVFCAVVSITIFLSLRVPL